MSDVTVEGALVVTAPVVEHAFTIRATIGATLLAGSGREGERRITPITGGTVAGPLLHGVVLAGGADYELARPDGTSRVEAHYVLQADDGTPIYIANRGLFVAPAEVTERLDRGEAVAASSYYFRTTPVFDVGAGRHGWLADHVFVADCRFTSEVVTIDVFVVR